MPTQFSVSDNYPNFENLLPPDKIKLLTFLLPLIKKKVKLLIVLKLQNIAKRQLMSSLSYQKKVNCNLLLLTSSVNVCYLFFSAHRWPFVSTIRYQE